MPRAFSPQAAADITRIRGRYPTDLAALIPTLFVAQREFGHLDEESMQLVADTLGVPLTKVISTATFYTMFNKAPVGQFHVQVCKNISCYLRNSDAVTHALERCLGVHPGETTADGQFTLTEVECLAACGRAPVVQINEDYHEWQTPESIRGVIDRLRTSKPAQTRPEGVSA
jgi:NADH-quinone oxidoreductase E subunit